MDNVSRRFTRVLEDFTCEHCGQSVTGSGFTNHCPQCLFSKHVDVNPGDRAAGCGGLMRPVSVRYQKDAYQILHECERCGLRHPNKAAPRDNRDVLIALMATPFQY